MRAGRECPLDYRLAPDSFAGEPLFNCETLYVVGGLYGNRQALAALQRRLSAEPGARVVFNGDAHWFDISPEIFLEIEAGLAAHTVLRGNVETELGRSEPGAAGCGCAYPDDVADATVDWSNQIHARLSETVSVLPGMRDALARRPATALVSVAGQHVAITHGDERSLAGWGCDRAALQRAERQAALDTWLHSNSLRVLATSHTCAPAALQLPNGVVINNGAAGMPNFNNGRYGLVTRIATRPHASALYRSRLAGLFIEAVPINYDHQAFQADFDRQWPADSPAQSSYRDRIDHGTTSPPEAALLGGFRLASTLCAMEDLHS
ncbi:hypothetical protein SAMN05216421_0685 [Halopseudomonas xinjiangensis]|uniref:Calcineurin-like phosphoesterase domain-containing protein n=1 Tax=Halopseudomonas xinjiangensis TaxID=487184 RepID=A0A1H1NHW6_9GAMM|nr:hypothetical protein [Halopseudomonas xinjiangensis]SDR98335.1 hypothetical protein SAMN05216421_0685 [Halopseudomonas xinjiangensis]